MNLNDFIMKLMLMIRPPDVIIGSPDNPYLLRWWLIPRNMYFNIYLHYFIRSDDDRALHDHPWHNLSFLLTGAYREKLFVDNIQSKGEIYSDHRVPGKIYTRGPRTAHRIILERDEDGKEKPLWTLFLTGPYIRTWGFYCPRKWIHWKEFTDTTLEGQSVYKHGCGEND